MRFLGGADELVELDLQGARFTVLRVLNDEHHEEGDDRRSGVDGELPVIGESEERACCRPGQNEYHGERHGSCAARPTRNARSKLREPCIEAFTFSHDQKAPG